jgi:two-component system sensor histidine kinase SenX3
VLDSLPVRHPRVLAGLLAPISLVVLVVALGALQYKWVGQASETDRAQLSQSMARRADEFAKDFDLELDRVFRTFRITEGFTPANGETFAKLLEDYKTAARFPAMVKATYYVEASDAAALKLHHFDAATRTFSEVEWPKSLAVIRSRLQLLSARSMPVGQTGTITFQTVSIFADVPAAVIPESEMPQVRRLEASERRTIEQHAAAQSAAGSWSSSGSYNVVMAPTGGRNHVIVEFDPQVIVETVLPALAARHFEDSGADNFRVAIVNYRGESVLTRGVPAGEALTAKNADTAAPFFRLRPEFRVASMTSLTGVSSRGGGTTTFQTAVPGGAIAEVQVKSAPTQAPPTAAPLGRGGAVMVARPSESERLSVVMQHAAGVVPAAAMPAGWTVMVQHGAGSLDAAVGRARRRNLYLSFGILGVLAASAMLVMVNARRSEKLAAQQMDFVATVSHELRTPLAVIRSAAQNLSAGVIGEPAQARRYGELIESEGRRLTDMVEQVLEYAGIAGNRRPPASRPVDLHDVVRDVVTTSQALPEAVDLAFDVRMDDGLPMVMADEDATRRALLNLVGNAVKYAADGGWIGITAARGHGRDDGFVQISVADRGRGIPAHELAHIFEPFYRGEFARDRQIHGNGLGLSLVKRIAESHGGKVTVRSAPGEGTTFVFALPVAPGVVAGTPARATPLALPNTGGSTS